MLRTGGRVGTAPFFWQFVNGTHGIPDCLKRVVPLGRQQLRRIRPLQWRHSLPPFFIAYGGPNRERSSPPLLTVLPLLIGENQEEGDGASNEGTWRPLRVGFLRGLFLALCDGGATFK